MTSACTLILYSRTINLYLTGTLLLVLAGEASVTEDLTAVLDIVIENGTNASVIQ